LIHGIVVLGPCTPFYSATFSNFNHKIFGFGGEIRNSQISRKFQKNFCSLILEQIFKVVFLGRRCSDLSDSSAHAKPTSSSTTLHHRIDTTPTIHGCKSVIIKIKGITNLLPLEPPQFSRTLPIGLAHLHCIGIALVSPRVLCLCTCESVVSIGLGISIIKNQKKREKRKDEERNE